LLLPELSHNLPIVQPLLSNLPLALHDKPIASYSNSGFPNSGITFENIWQNSVGGENHWDRLFSNTGNCFSKNSVFWNITPCSLLKVSRRFGGTCRLDLDEWSHSWI
jgi:hypothetical protein